ncbi:MAG: hypothetical protein V3569_01715 [Acholeplasmataceae bacterium]|nr:hypothetical protein [Acholeplasmataceae bacterium]
MIYNAHTAWLKELFPHGIDANESILISGPGGSGKPLVELAFVDSWLKNGGSVIGIPLQYPSLEMVNQSMYEIYKTDLKAYHKHVVMIAFNPTLNDEILIKDQVISANLILPGMWEKTMNEAISKLEPSKLGVLVFASALNLLLFNEHYKEDMLFLIKNILSGNTQYTSLFTVSNNVYPEDIKIWEDAADNLMFTELSQEKILTLFIKRIKHSYCTQHQKIIPIDAKVLSEIEIIAKSTRNKNIQAIKAIT